MKLIDRVGQPVNRIYRGALIVVFSVLSFVVRSIGQEASELETNDDTALNFLQSIADLYQLPEQEAWAFDWQIHMRGNGCFCVRSIDGEDEQRGKTVFQIRGSLSVQGLTSNGEFEYRANRTKGIETVFTRTEPHGWLRASIVRLQYLNCTQSCFDPYKLWPLLIAELTPDWRLANNRLSIMARDEQHVVIRWVQASAREVIFKFKIEDGIQLIEWKQVLFGDPTKHSKKVQRTDVFKIINERYGTVWVPNQMHVSVRGEDIAGKKVYGEMDMWMTNWSRIVPPADWLEIKYPKGTRVEDNLRGVAEYVGGQSIAEEGLERLVDSLEPLTSISRNRNAWRWVGALTLLVAVLVIGLVIYRRRSRAS